MMCRRFAVALVVVVFVAESALCRPPAVGIQKRSPWTTSRLIGSPDPPAPYALERMFAPLKFKNPVVLTNAPGTPRLFLCELGGRIVSFDPRSKSPTESLFFELKKHNKQARQVYGLTFHPKFATNRLCFVCYVGKAGVENGTRVSRFRVTKSDPPRIIPQSETVLITWKSGGHNGGCLKFGPDGFLYISTGDSGPAFPADEIGTGQDISDLLASILRIDVDRAEKGRPYRIPPDNPFVGRRNARGEIWTYGHRNPWKMSFDSRTGDLWVGDVGWEMWEMIYRVKKGDNYGWSVVEASQDVHPEGNRGPTPIVPPTIAHDHTEAKSITGGFVYRGTRLKELAGWYIYGDYVTGKIWAARHDGKKIAAKKELLDATIQVICFGTDNDNELYVVAYDGAIYRIVRNNAAAANKNFPRKLSQTGLFASVSRQSPAPGVVPYSIIAEPWMDGARADRFIALPGMSSIDLHTKNDPQRGVLRGEWKFPANSVLVKTIRLPVVENGQPQWRKIETQILHRDGDVWKPYNYIWNKSQTDAELQQGPGRDAVFEVKFPGRPARKQTWHHAGRTQCLVCHASRGGWVNGFQPEQLQKHHRYSDATADQLATLQHIRIIRQTPKRKRPRLVNPRDQKRLADAARSYLHVNCAMCHRRGGGGTSRFELLSEKLLRDKYLFAAEPTQGTFGFPDAKVVSPGDPGRSVLLYRLAKLGRGRMPHIGSNVVDHQGVALISRWIAHTDSTGKTTQGAHPLAKRISQANQPIKRVVQQAIASCASGKPNTNLIEQALASPHTAFHLWLALLGKEPEGHTYRPIIAQAVKNQDPRVRDLFEPFLPESARTRRLGSVVDVAKILKMRGDANKGRAVFFRKSGASCASCHTIGKEGKTLGPDLSHIGKQRRPAEILESILQPSKKIDAKHRTYAVQTTRGRVITGILVKRNAIETVLRDRLGKTHRIEAKDIRRFAPQATSLMPDLLFREMTAQQLADLLAYLRSRR